MIWKVTSVLPLSDRPLVISILSSFSRMRAKIMAFGLLDMDAARKVLTALRSTVRYCGVLLSGMMMGRAGLSKYFWAISLELLITRILSRITIRLASFFILAALAVSMELLAAINLAVSCISLAGSPRVATKYIFTFFFVVSAIAVVSLTAAIRMSPPKIAERSLTDDPCFPRTESIRWL